MVTITTKHIDALNSLNAMSDDEFLAFFNLLPLRVRMLVKSGLVDWREILPQWYESTKNVETTSV